MSAFGVELADELINVGLAGPDGTEVAHLGVLRIADIGDRDGLLMDIQTDVECARVFYG
ncbi:MAG: hypothetical protein L0387_39640 [Acidobacteria bacterium]|nr:hypothetical protein [Acidobacteriota bacterium]